MDLILLKIGSMQFFFHVPVTPLTFYQNLCFYRYVRTLIVFCTNLFLILDSLFLSFFKNRRYRVESDSFPTSFLVHCWINYIPKVRLLFFCSFFFYVFVILLVSTSVHFTFHTANCWLSSSFMILKFAQITSHNFYIIFLYQPDSWER